MANDLIHTIIRSKRRTLGLEITSDARLIIRAPMKAPVDYIHRIVEQKRNWILRKQQRAQEKYKPIRKKEFVDGEEFMYLGVPYRLRVVTEGRCPFEFTGTEFIIEEGALHHARDIFQRWYCLQARELLSARVAMYARMIGQSYAEITINVARTRWGSCNSNRKLNFTWRLMMAPLEMIDYVVAHEVAHLKELNHSSKFWDKVQSLMPDYRLREQWFRDHQHQLTI
jgi:predicted metal-dependent hydrolase